MKVQCPMCKVLCHKTTDNYDPDVRPNRSMVELLPPWSSWGWGDGINDLECPACEAPLAPSGRLRVVSDNHGKGRTKEQTEQVVGMFNTIKIPVTIIDDLTCEVCGKVCKSALGLHSHKRSHQKVANG